MALRMTEAEFKTMMGNADGQISIVTDVSAAGLNEGIKNVEKSVDNAAKSVGHHMGNASKKVETFAEKFQKTFAGKILTSLVGFGKTFLKILGAVTIGFFFLILAMQRWSSRAWTALERNIDKTSEYHHLLEKLKTQYNLLEGTIMSVFANLLQVSLPILIKIVDWLTNMINKANMFLGALFGQKTVLKAIVKATQEQKKAQEGVLAAFDQINILQQKQADEQADTNPITFQSVPIDDKTLALVDRIKAAWLSLIKAITDVWNFFVRAWNTFWASPFGQTLTRLWENFKTTWKAIFDNTMQTLEDIKAGFLRIWNGVIEFLTGVVTGDWKLVFKGLEDIALGAWDIIFALVKGTLNNILILAAGNINALKIIFNGLFPFFASLWLSLSKGFSEAIAKITIGWTLLWNGISILTKSAINVIIDFVNGMIRAIVTGINTAIAAINAIHFSIPNWIPIFGGQSVGFSIPTATAPQIPRLAEGAVIPPNARFLAMLGDQTSGRNLEAPEELIRQIIRDEVGQNQVINLTATLDGEVVFKNQQRVSKRHGKSLLAGGVV